ncbi:MAG: Y4bD/Y4pK family protein [Actinobacteria bacterium]|nr:Y4bD/Y4pK family protein [Actinomycetota bacterium]
MFFRVTHPFHPLKGQEFEIIKYGYAWDYERVFYYDEDGKLRSIPAIWTDICTPDPFLTVSRGRSLFKIQELLDLFLLLSRLKERTKDENPAS